MNIRELIKKIDNALRPPHVGPRQPTSITALGGTLDPDSAAQVGGNEAAKTAQQPGGMGL